jgi:hypothetical protein
MRHYAALCGKTIEERSPAAPVEKRAVQFPPDLHSGSETELRMVATQRRVDFWAVAAMQRTGVLHFGTVCGHPSWIVTDEARLCAEARRLDGAPFPGSGKRGVRKAHTLAGSSKSWPVGLRIANTRPECFRKILWVEGSGDLVAAYHFVLHAGDWLPVAMLGASLRNVHPDAAQWLRHKQVRIVPHSDDAGRQGMEHWGTLLSGLDCEVDMFDLTGLRRADGQPVKDLNDCTALHPESHSELEGLLQ